MTNVETRWQKVHPGVVLALILTHVITAFLWDSPVLLVGQLVFLAVWLQIEGCLRRVLPFLGMGLVFMGMFFLVGPLFSSNGVTFLWKGPLVPVIGRLDLTLEEVVYAALSNLRLLVMLFGTMAYQWFVDHDRFLFQFARIAPRFVITSVMAIRLFPFLAGELQRITEVARTRGIYPSANPTFKERIAYGQFLLKPLLLSSLEGSWMTAESLYARGFGSGRRSFYRSVEMLDHEKLVLFVIVGIFGLTMFGWGLDFGRFATYPQLIWYDWVGDLMFLAVLAAVWSIPLMWLGRRNTD
ncbi:energy-coupling factor transporter transmembrane component T family protein [Brevibacillus dissolubilis]|uniref:energy-coupling factor transporter transmembrane component T family protein n=1 Tax=Brevibacillus dissolubilis TaxID=1844116 RepID=UPI001116598E|nr:energy-coupling factor transporter transmembrane component T [Brevibacillus dissolubilis]